MSKSVLLEQALVLSAIDISAMLRGQLIVAIPRVQIARGISFLLCPEQSVSQNEIVKEYRSPFLSLAEMAVPPNLGGNIQLEAWATCEQTQMIHDIDQLSTLSSLTVWNGSYLEELLKERQYLFLSYLKVHRLSNWITLPAEKVPSGKLGKFVGLSDEQPKLNFDPVKITNLLPILSDRLFAHRKQQLENLTPPEHSELEELQSSIERYAQDHPEAKNFSNELQAFLGWSEGKEAINHLQDWISEITTSGNSSDGNLFEKRVRQAFMMLGFTNTLKHPKVSLDPSAAGGSGGIDFYCQFPYSIYGECKASKSLKVSDNTDGAPFQLIKLGNKWQGKKELNLPIFSDSIKIIMAPGELTKDANLTARGNQMNIMRPETLQRLVELKTAHPGSIDLLELKPCLESAPFGTDADTKVNEFIDKIYQRLRVRSHVVSAFKSCIEKNKLKEISIERFCGFFDSSNSSQHLSDRELYDILIELSSPLTGYLGRIKDKDWKTDRFYFLRDLMV